MHFSFDSGSSIFRAGLGQLGTDQKPQSKEAEERQALQVSTNRGSDPPLNGGSLGAEQSDQHCCTRPEGSACRSPPTRSQHCLPPALLLDHSGCPSSLPTCQPPSLPQCSVILHPNTPTPPACPRDALTCCCTPERAKSIFEDRTRKIPMDQKVLADTILFKSLKRMSPGTRIQGVSLK